jgi:CheY-like chemotaxis protein/predicted transcriptional regulator
VDRLQEDNIVGDPLEDNIGGQRSKFDVMATILNICLGGSLKNHIIGKGNFSDAMANHYLSILLYHNLLGSSDENGRMFYRTTGKGRQFINHYVDIQNLFKRVEAPAPAHDSKPEPLRPSSEAGYQQTSPKRILVVDDESDISSAMKIGLEDNGFTVNVFNDPLSVLGSYRPGAYDLLILDVKMPKMNGFELYKAMYGIDPEAGYCFITAFEIRASEFKKMFPTTKITCFLKKPFSADDLVELLEDEVGYAPTSAH